MGKLKEFYLSNLSEEEIEQFYESKIQDELEYEEYLNSQEYIDKVNEELELAKANFSFTDIEFALKYASESVTIYPEEVGKDVYDILFSEKVIEYLLNRKDELEKIYR